MIVDVDDECELWVFELVVYILGFGSVLNWIVEMWGCCGDGDGTRMCLAG